jgi:hypothetical protein
MVATREQTSFPDKAPKRTEILYPFSVDPILREHVSRDGILGMGTSQGMGPVTTILRYHLGGTACDSHPRAGA